MERIAVLTSGGDAPGVNAAEHLAQSEHGLLVGLLRGKIATTPLSKVVASQKPLDTRLPERAQVLAQ